MSQIIDILARAVARRRRRVVPLRTATTVVPDDGPVFGFTPIKVVSEEVIQAIAFGDLDRAPTVVTRWNPLSRDAEAFEAFAKALDAHILRALANGWLPRVWVPHHAAFVLLDLLGHRYRTNRQASDALRRMGAQCQVLAEEARHPGQQAVIVGTEILTTHAATGMAPTEDHHLGALLAWHEADGTYDPIDEADARALLPAAAMLPRDFDDRVEALRPRAKSGDGAARAEIEEILRRGALREWDLLVRARRAFRALGLAPLPRALELARMSRERLEWTLRELPKPASRPAALGNLLEHHEWGATLQEDVETSGDARVRERARRAGKVVLAEVVAVDQPTPGRHPCVLTLRTEQPVLRVRRGTELRSSDCAVIGRVEGVQRGREPGAQLIELRLSKGVRRSDLPAVGDRIDWMDSVPFDGRRLRSQAYRAARDAGAFTFADGPLPGPQPRDLGPDDLARVAEELRRG